MLPNTSIINSLQDILKAYQAHSDLQALATELGQGTSPKLHLHGMAGSQLALLVAALWRLSQRSILVVLNDKEEALYFQNDLEQLLPKKEIFLFPASYKRPYEPQEIDNANVLQQAETLNALNHTKAGRQVVVSFAEALTEKVINRSSLRRSTEDIVAGQQLDRDFVIEILEEYGYEREDFAYEPGQYAVRGGLVDVFTFAHDLPYRIEFFGDEIESIRLFDPVSQMSESEVKRISLIPNIQTHLIEEERVPFMHFMPEHTLTFVKSIDFVVAELDRMYEKAEDRYAVLQQKSGGGASSSPPGRLYLRGEEFLQALEQSAGHRGRSAALF